MKKIYSNYRDRTSLIENITNDLEKSLPEYLNFNYIDRVVIVEIVENN